MQPSHVVIALASILAACGGSDHAVPVDAMADAPALATTRVPLTGCAYTYTGEFDVGGTPFRLAVDTGSPSVGVAGARCATCSAAQVSPLYTPGPTATDQHRVATLAYGDGSTKLVGEVYQDAVSAGSLPPVALSFVDVASQTDFFYAGMCGNPQGILGLSPASGLAPGTTSYPTLLAAAGASDVFAMHYCLGNGDLWLDGYDPAATAGEPSYVAMAQQGLYTVDLQDIAVDGKSVGVPAAMYGRAIVDSGGPSLGVPQAAYAAITTTVAASPAFTSRFGDISWFTNQGCKVLTETRAQIDAALPKLTIQVGSPAVSLDLPATASYLATGPGQGGIMYCAAIFASPSITDLGNSVLRSHVVIFDRAQQRMGFAPAPPCAD